MRDVQEVVETAIGGTQVTEVLEGARRFPVVVRLPRAVRESPEAIANILSELAACYLLQLDPPD